MAKMAGQTRAVEPVLIPIIDFQKILSQVEDTTLQIHTCISAQPVINYQGVDLTYWDELTSAKLQNLHDTLHVSQQRMATFALVLSKHDARTDKAYAFMTAQIYLDSAGDLTGVCCKSLVTYTTPICTNIW